MPGNRYFSGHLLRRIALACLCLCAFTACNAASSPAGSNTVSTQLKSYRLFSWKTEDQSWNYALLAARREAFSPEELNAAKLVDLDQLKSLLFQLNASTIVFWNSDLPDFSANGFDFGLPEGSVLADIRRLANRKGLVLEVF